MRLIDNLFQRRRSLSITILIIRVLASCFFTCPLWCDDVKWRDTRPSSQQMTANMQILFYSFTLSPRLYTKQQRRSNMVQGDGLLRLFGLLWIIFLKQRTVSSSKHMCYYCLETFREEFCLGLVQNFE